MERMAAFWQDLQKLDGTDGRDMQIDFRDGDVGAARYRKLRKNWPRLRGGP